MHAWIEWIVHLDLPFSFVESSLTRKNTNLPKTSVETVIQKMEMVSEKVMHRIADLLPSQFGLMIDGWTEGGTHYVAVFAIYHTPGDPSADEAGDCYVLLSMSPLLDEGSYTAENHAEYLDDVLNMYGKNRSNLLYLVADNCHTNSCLATLLKIPLFGCHSHKLNLAVEVMSFLSRCTRFV